MGCVVATALAIGLISFFGFRRVVRDQQEQSVASHARSEGRRLVLALEEIHHDVKLLATLPAVQELASAESGPLAPDVVSAHTRSLQRVFAQFLRAKPFYTQVRLIGVADGGRELVRADRIDDDIRVVQQDGLQKKGGRDYFTETLKLSPDGVYVSPINLNREHGEIEVPHRPMLRSAARVDSKADERFGIVIINLDFGRFVDNLFGDVVENYELFLANREGDYLLHPDQSKAFGFDLGKRFQVQAEFPELGRLFQPGAKKATAWVTGADSAASRVVSFRTIQFVPDDPERSLLLGIAASGEILAASARNVARNSLLATVFFVIVAMMIAVVAGHFQTRSIKQLTEATQRLRRGESLPELPTQQQDELGELARQFQSMAHAIRKKEAEITESNQKLASANADLEHFVHIAAHDLREPLRKQRNLVDLVVSSDTAIASDDDVTTLLDFVNDCSHQMQRMIDSFRALSSVGLVNLTREPASIKEIIEECLADRAGELRNRDVRVAFDVFPHTVNVYPDLVKQLYANLIANTLAHVEMDGFEIRFLARQVDGVWEFGVENTGSSIPEELRADIFHMFRKGASSDGGSGVGLSICKRIVERHRGYIKVESSDRLVRFLFSFGVEEDGSA